MEESARRALPACLIAAAVFSLMVLSPATGLSQGSVWETGQCVSVLSSSNGTWKLAWGGGLPIPRVISTRASSPPWGSVIPGTAARWVYFRDPNWAHLGDFQTGPNRDPQTATVVRFWKNLTSQFNSDRVASAQIRITADNGYFLHVAGRRVGGTFDPLQRRWLKSPESGWRTFETWDVRDAIGRGPGAIDITVDVADFGGFAEFLLDGTFCAQPGFTLTVPR